MARACGDAGGHRCHEGCRAGWRPRAAHRRPLLGRHPRLLHGPRAAEAVDGGPIALVGEGDRIASTWPPTQSTCWSTPRSRPRRARGGSPPSPATPPASSPSTPAWPPARRRAPSPRPGDPGRPRRAGGPAGRVRLRLPRDGGRRPRRTSVAVQPGARRRSSSSIERPRPPFDGQRLRPGRCHASCGRPRPRAATASSSTARHRSAGDTTVLIARSRPSSPPRPRAGWLALRLRLLAHRRRRRADPIPGCPPAPHAILATVIASTALRRRRHSRTHLAHAALRVRLIDLRFREVVVVFVTLSHPPPGSP